MIIKIDQLTTTYVVYHTISNTNKYKFNLNYIYDLTYNENKTLLLIVLLIYLLIIVLLLLTIFCIIIIFLPNAMNYKIINYI